MTRLMVALRVPQTVPLLCLRHDFGLAQPLANFVERPLTRWHPCPTRRTGLDRFLTPDCEVLPLHSEGRRLLYNG